MRLFSAQTYGSRRNALIEKVKTGLILLPGHQNSSINFKDNHYRFRQDSNFLYYFGLNLPNLFATIDCESGEAVIYGDDPTPDEIVWTGPQDSVKDLAEKCGVLSTARLSKLELAVNSALKAGRHIHFCPTYRPEQHIHLAQLTGRTVDDIQRGASPSLIRAVAAQRSLKSQEEIEEIERAVDRSAQLHISAIRWAKAGMKEYELKSKIQQIAEGYGGRTSFPPIITKNGHILHNLTDTNTIQDGDMLLCDMGAETDMGYCGDLTRTFPVGENFTLQQQEIYQIVLQAIDHAANCLAPQTPFINIHLEASQILFEGLKALGLCKGDADEAVNMGVHTLFFQCGLGHHMGLDVHDMDSLGESYIGYTESLKKSTAFGLKSLRLGKALEQGFVVTVEPGIYFIPALIDQWSAQKKFADFLNYKEIHKYRNFGGIRIEDDYVITKNGAGLLGQPAQKQSVISVHSKVKTPSF